MITINVRNVHEALPIALQRLNTYGIRRESRGGPVLWSPNGPVATVYEHPEEKVIFYPERDANPFFHLYESLWMLAGRNDVAPLVRYVARSREYSDDGITQHGAYGHRWRKHFGFDQLKEIALRLTEKPDERRGVLQMWDSHVDGVGGPGKDYPCNTMATFQRGPQGELNLDVFCRSNDIVWGAYGANAVQFGTLLEYMAAWIKCSIGTYTQISVNWHAYLSTFETVKALAADDRDLMGYRRIRDPYSHGLVRNVPMPLDVGYTDEAIKLLLAVADNGNFQETPVPEPWTNMIHRVLWAHHLYKSNEGYDRYRRSLEVLSNDDADPRADWIVAAKQWIQRRYMKFEAEAAVGKV